MKRQERPSDGHPPIFTPDNEPYLGRQYVLMFDRVIVAALKRNEETARFTHGETHRLSELQLAASQIIPQGVSIALSIRELIRQGYLLSAFILVRPLIERAAIVSYLHAKPEAVELWKRGWPRGKRPGLKAMLATIHDADVEKAQEFIQQFNHLVHGDPVSSLFKQIDVDGRPAYSSGKTLDEPERCDVICVCAFGYLMFLVKAMDDIFPRQSES